MEQRLPFASDYMFGAHPAVLTRLNETNMLPAGGYGLDDFSESAREKIRTACRCPDGAVYFLSGGTQTNATVIGALLRSYQGVIAADSGHIATHEAGAIEFGGHKVLTLAQRDGKIAAEDIESLCVAFHNDANHDHIVMPGLVYLSQPTEYATLYSLAELKAIRRVCDAYDLKLYVDGARLAYALGCGKNDVTLAELARLCDAFYIGGTKCGALFGEAVVFPDPGLEPAFFTISKQNGALFAKGRLLGVQFDTLFSNDLYTQIGKTAVVAADEIRALFRRAGYRLAVDAPTNQIFLNVDEREMAALAEDIDFGFWEKTDADHTTIRLATSWATTATDIEALAEVLAK